MRGVTPAVGPAEAVVDSVDRAPAEAMPQDDDSETDIVESPPVAVVDTTAELLGRAKPRRPRTRAAGSAHSAASGGSTPARVTRRSGARQPAAAGPKKSAASPRRSRSKTTTASSEDKKNS